MNEFYRYQVDIAFEYENEGKTTKESESWLIKAVSVTDAETKANKVIEGFNAVTSLMECRIKNVKETKITKVLE